MNASGLSHGTAPLEKPGLEAVKQCIKRFHEKAGALSSLEPALEAFTQKSLVAETAHQAFFLPYPGFFRKAVAAESLAGGGTAVFGLIDNDLAQLHAQYESRFPALRSNGCFTLGIPRKIDGKNAFCCEPKPARSEWTECVQGVEKVYGDSFTGPLWDCFKRGGSMSEINAVFVARAAEAMGCKTLFFLYSDLARQDAFVKEARKLISSEFTNAYNAVLGRRKTSLKRLAANESLFWHACECGLKNPVFFEGESLSSPCACGRQEVDEKRLSTKAVARNILMAGLLGSNVYVSGSAAFDEKWGSYGAVAFELSRALGLKPPESVVWKNTDVFVSSTRAAALALAGLGSKASSTTAAGVGKEISVLSKEFKELKTRLTGLREKEAEAFKAAAGSLASEQRKKFFKQKKGLLERMQVLQNRLARLEMLKNLFEKEFAVLELASVAGWNGMRKNWLRAFAGARPRKKGRFTEFDTVTLHG